MDPVSKHLRPDLSVVVGGCCASKENFPRSERYQRELKYEGVLKKIMEMGKSREPINSFRGIGERSTYAGEAGEYYSKLEISFGEKSEIITYFGIILPDSIGHRVEIYGIKDSFFPFLREVRIEIRDVDLDRFYH